jgi:hypothetical protein
MVALALDETAVLRRGDEVSFDNGASWKHAPILGIRASPGVAGLRYRRPILDPPIQQQTQFLHRASAQTPAVSSLESDTLKQILAKESEHVAVIEQNNRGRDRAVDLGIELRRMRESFAGRFRDRLFIVGDRVIDTSDGNYNARSAEVVS